MHGHRVVRVHFQGEAVRVGHVRNASFVLFDIVFSCVHSLSPAVCVSLLRALRLFPTIEDLRFTSDLPCRGHIVAMVWFVVQLRKDWAGRHGAVWGDVVCCRRPRSKV